jgi:hypothetical protein
MNEITIKNNHQVRVGLLRVAVRGTLPVREHDGSVRSRSVIVTPDGDTEIFEGDEVELGGTRYRVAIDVSVPKVTLTPVEP